VTGHPSPTRRLPQPSPVGEARNPSCSPRPLPLAVSVAARPARRSLALVSCYLQKCKSNVVCQPIQTCSTSHPTPTAPRRCPGCAQPCRARPGAARSGSPLPRFGPRRQPRHCCPSCSSELSSGLFEPCCPLSTAGSLSAVHFFSFLGT
jgi:hypothetical protein